MILNSAVRIIVLMPRYSTERYTPRAIELNFLHVKARFEFKICLSAHKSSLSGKSRYIKNLLQPVPISSLRSSRSNRLIELFLSSQISIERAFCHYAPRFYNQLPLERRTIDYLYTFKKKLKICFLNKANDLDNLVLNTNHKV